MKPTPILSTQLSILLALDAKSNTADQMINLVQFYPVLYLVDNPPCLGIANNEPNKSEFAWPRAEPSTDVGIIDGQRQQLLGPRRINIAQHANIKLEMIYIASRQNVRMAFMTCVSMDSSQQSRVSYNSGLSSRGHPKANHSKSKYLQLR